MKIRSTLIILIIFLFIGCRENTKPNNDSPIKTIRTNKTITKRSVNVSKICYGDVEFDMSIYEAISSNVFEGKDSSRNDCMTSTVSDCCKQWYSLGIDKLAIKDKLVTNKTDVSNWEEFIYKNIETKECDLQIGELTYLVGSSFYDNQLYVFYIICKDNKDLKNLIDIVSIKYGEPRTFDIQKPIKRKFLSERMKKLIDDLKKSSSIILDNGAIHDPYIEKCIFVPNPYVIKEWKTDTKEIKIYQVYDYFECEFDNREREEYKIDKKYKYYYMFNKAYYVLEMTQEQKIDSIYSAMRDNIINLQTIVKDSITDIKQESAKNF